VILGLLTKIYAAASSTNVENNRFIPGWKSASSSGCHWTAIRWRSEIAANKLGGGLQLHWLGFIFEDVVIQKSPRYCRDQQNADQHLFNTFWYSH